MIRVDAEDVLLRWWRSAWRSNPPGPAPAMITRRVSIVSVGLHIVNFRCFAFWKGVLCFMLVLESSSSLEGDEAVEAVSQHALLASQGQTNADVKNAVPFCILYSQTYLLQLKPWQWLCYVHTYYKLQHHNNI